jgi:hypothetical protein
MRAPGRPGTACRGSPGAADAGHAGGAGGAEIAARAQCCRDTVYAAIRTLEAAEVLTWVNRLIRVQYRERDLFGQLALRSRLVRTSNAYVFRDPLPCAQGRPARKKAGQGARRARFPSLHPLSRKIPPEP